MTNIIQKTLTQAALVFGFISLAPLAFSESYCPTGHLKNLNYQVLLTSNTGSLKRISIKRNEFFVDEYSEDITATVDVRKILKTKGFEKGIAKIKISSNRYIATSKDLGTSIFLSQFENRNAKLPKNPDPSLHPFQTVLFKIGDDGYTINEEEFDVFTKGERIKTSIRPNKMFRRSIDTITFSVFCNDNPIFDDFEFVDEFFDPAIHN